MPIGKRTRKTNGPSPYHRAKSLDTILKVKVAIKATAGYGLPVTLRTLSDATALFFGEDRRVTEKGLLGNPITCRLYFHYTTSRKRRTSRVRPIGSRADRSKSAAQMREEKADLVRRLEASEAARRNEIVARREGAVASASAEARRTRRSAPAHVAPAVVNLTPGLLRRGRHRPGQG